MKTKHLLTILIAIIALFPLSLHGAIEAEVEKSSLTIHFYNVGDVPPALAYMSIRFNSISKKEEEKVKEWRNEIGKKIREAGGVFKEEDYAKITRIIPDYVVRFIQTGATSVILEFPRARQGIILHKQR